MLSDAEQAQQLEVIAIKIRARNYHGSPAMCRPSGGRALVAYDELKRAIQSVHNSSLRQGYQDLLDHAPSLPPPTVERPRTPKMVSLTQSAPPPVPGPLQDNYDVQESMYMRANVPLSHVAGQETRNYGLPDPNSPDWLQSAYSDARQRWNAHHQAPLAPPAPRRRDSGRAILPPLGSILHPASSPQSRSSTPWNGTSSARVGQTAMDDGDSSRVGEVERSQVPKRRGADYPWG